MKLSFLGHLFCLLSNHVSLRRIALLNIFELLFHDPALLSI